MNTYMNKTVRHYLKRYGFTEKKHHFVSSTYPVSLSKDIAMEKKFSDDEYFDFDIFQMEDGSFIGNIGETWIYGKTFNEFILNSIIDMKLCLIHLDSKESNPYLSPDRARKKKRCVNKVFNLLKSIILDLAIDIDII